MTLAHSVDLDLRRPFTRADAIAAGVSASSLRGSNFRRIFRGVYIHASVPDHPLIRVQAALVIHPPTAFASHLSAARVYDVPLPALADEHVTVLTEADRRTRPGICTHVTTDADPATTVRGLRVSRPASMFAQLADILDLVDLVVVGDNLVRMGRVTPGELVAYCAAAGPHARRAAALVRARVDSPMETRLRLLVVLAGLPEPEVNLPIRDADGRELLRFDLSWPALKLALEYDGRQHRADLDQWDHDLDREDWFDENGWRHVVVVARGIFRRPDLTLARVVRALASRGARLPRRLSDDWRPHFPVRH